MRLTEISIRSLSTPSKGVVIYSDDVLTGFGVRVSEGGTKSYVLRRLASSPRSAQWRGKAHQPDKTKSSGRGACERAITDSPLLSGLSFSRGWRTNGLFFCRAAGPVLQSATRQYPPPKFDLQSPTECLCTFDLRRHIQIVRPPFSNACQA